MRSQACFLMAICVLGTSAHAQSTGRLLYTFSQIAIGGGYETTLVIGNPRSFNGSRQYCWLGRAHLYQDNEKDWSGLNPEIPGISVCPNQTVTLRFNSGSSSVAAGYLRLYNTNESEAPIISAVLFYNLYDQDSGALIDSVGGISTRIGTSSSSAVLPFQISKSKGIDTAIALAPAVAGQAPGPIQLTLWFGPSGTFFQEKTIQFTGHRAVFISEEFPDVTEYSGFLEINCNLSPKYLTTLRMQRSANGVQFTSFIPYVLQ